MGSDHQQLRERWLRKCVSFIFPSFKLISADHLQCSACLRSPFYKTDMTLHGVGELGVCRDIGSWNAKSVDDGRQGSGQEIPKELNNFHTCDCHFVIFDDCSFVIAFYCAYTHSRSSFFKKNPFKLSEAVAQGVLDMARHDREPRTLIPDMFHTSFS